MGKLYVHALGAPTPAKSRVLACRPVRAYNSRTWLQRIGGWLQRIGGWDPCAVREGKFFPSGRCPWMESPVTARRDVVSALLCSRSAGTTKLGSHVPI